MPTNMQTDKTVIFFNVLISLPSPDLTPILSLLEESGVREREIKLVLFVIIFSHLLKKVPLVMNSFKLLSTRSFPEYFHGVIWCVK